MVNWREIRDGLPRIWRRAHQIAPMRTNRKDCLEGVKRLKRRDLLAPQEQPRCEQAPGEFVLRGILSLLTGLPSGPSLNSQPLSEG